LLLIKTGDNKMNLKEWYKYLYNEVNITELERVDNAGRDMYAKFAQAIYDKLKQKNTKWLKVEQVAERYNVSPQWVRTEATAGNFPQPLKRSSKMFRWNVEELDKFDEKKRKANL